ncbi:MAG: hypothetical protein JO283_03885 [Bradyrhizobium sp.]|nr:hypothetical protein [Bradyrhizobium sp.]
MTGLRIHFVRADLGRVDDCRHVVAEAKRIFDKIHVVVNAGARTERGTILDTSPGKSSGPSTGQMAAA